MTMTIHSELDHAAINIVESDFPSIDRRDGVPEFKLLVIGTRGAGKTVFISALFNQLKANNESFYLIRTDDLSRRNLMKTYNNVKGVDADWPKGSVIPIRYKFSAYHQGYSNDIHVFDFNYVDFPGSFVLGDTGEPQFSAGDAQGQFDIQVEVEKTHSLVVLIDGLSVLRRIKKIEEDGPGLFDEIDSMIDLISRCARRPIQFVVTKFDILTNVSLKEVHDVLMESKKIRNFIKMRRQRNIPTHLIGVSAIGNSFADCDPLTGRMTKRKGAQPEPYNLDVIMSFAVTDALLMALKPTAEGLDKSSKFLARFGPVAGVIRGLLGIAKHSSSNVIGYFVFAAFQKVVEKAKLSSEEQRQSIQTALAHIKDVNDAIEAILSAQQVAIADYLGENPACDLLSSSEA